MALLGGDTFGCGNTGCPPVSNQNLVDRFESVGLTWKGYMEDQNVASAAIQAIMNRILQNTIRL